MLGLAVKIPFNINTWHFKKPQSVDPYKIHPVDGVHGHSSPPCLFWINDSSSENLFIYMHVHLETNTYIHMRTCYVHLDS